MESNREGQATAPLCIVEGCQNLSALSHVARGRFLVYTAHYCASHYSQLASGEELKIDRSRITIERIGEGGDRPA